MDVARERTIGDVGVDFASGTTYTLLITEWPSSPSEGDDEQVRNMIFALSSRFDKYSQMNYVLVSFYLLSLHDPRFPILNGFAPKNRKYHV